MLSIQEVDSSEVDVGCGCWSDGVSNHNLGSSRTL